MLSCVVRAHLIQHNLRVLNENKFKFTWFLWGKELLSKPATIKTAQAEIFRHHYRSEFAI